MGEEEGGKRAHGHNEATNCLKTKPKKKGGGEKMPENYRDLGR
jgi:hypothetical protein